MNRRQRPAAGPAPEGRDLERRLDLDPGLIEDIRGRLAEIPPPPAVVQQVLAEIADPLSTARSVAEVVRTDPALTGALLHAINASFHGLENEVADVQQAIALLGYDLVQSLVLQFGLVGLFPSTTHEVGYNTEDLWVHSLATSLVAIVLGRRSRNVDVGFAATLGLLHDIGKLAIHAKFPDRSRRLFEEWRFEESFLDREARLFGADHAFVGAHLARRWNLPDDLVAGIQWHHAPAFAPLDRLPERVRRAVFLVFVANQVVKHCHVYCEDAEIDLIPERFAMALGLPVDIEDNIDREVRQAITRAVAFVDEASDRPLKAVGRILRTRTAAEIAGLDALPTDLPGLDRIEIAEIGPIGRQAPRQVDLERVGEIDAVDLVGATDVLFAGRSTERDVARLLSLVRRAMSGAGLPRSIRFAFGFLTKLVLGNVLWRATGEELLQIRLRIDEGEVVLAFESSTLAFAHVLDVEAVRRDLGEAEAARRSAAILATGLGHLLTMGWVDRVRADLAGVRLEFVRGRRES